MVFCSGGRKEAAPFSARYIASAPWRDNETEGKSRLKKTTAARSWKRPSKPEFGGRGRKAKETETIQPELHRLFIVDR